MVSFSIEEKKEVLKSILNKEIVAVHRQLFKNDMSMVDYEQSADGPIEFTMSDGTNIHFLANTENLSVEVCAGKMPLYGDSYLWVDVSGNYFWKDRIRCKIDEIEVLQDLNWNEEYSCEFGVLISFSNKNKVMIVYKDEDNYHDMIFLCANYNGLPCIITNVK
ncbi:hypothetical protein [Vibrio navarrensis]|uniref:hypothetical protein n=1 Tax=Vibrio navarrensis TaxID=29495 RepID=UPI001558777D|nr:hypothetical protein [Vibrio navarrensis]